MAVTPASHPVTPPPRTRIGPRLRARVMRLRPPRLSVFLAVVGLAPLAALAVLAVFGQDNGETLRLAQTRLGALTLTSLAVTSLSAIGAGVLGVGLAWLVSMYRFPGRAILDAALYLPLAAPAYVLAYAYLDLTSAAGPLQTSLRDATGWRVGEYVFPHIRGVGGAAFVFSLCLYPYVYALARRAFAEQAGALLDAARSLGDGPWRAFMRVAAPLARPAVIAGGALVAMEVLADYGAVLHLGAPTLTVGIMRAWSAAGEPVAAARLAAMLVIVCLGLLAIERRARRSAKLAHSAHGHAEPRLRPLTGWRAWAALGGCLAVLAFALVVPMVHLVSLALESGPARGVVAATLRSALLGGAAALALCAIGFGVASAARFGDRSARALQTLTAAGYATPGAAAALGVLALMGAVNGLSGLSIGVALGPLLLILAYQTRFAAAALSPAAAALDRAPHALDDAARALGCTRPETAQRVHWPLARSAIVTASLLVFVEVVKELPATIILRPFDFDTLAVLAHAYAADERLAQAASPALALVALCAPVMALAAWSLRTRDSL